MLTGLRHRLRAWGRRHSYSFFSSLGALLSNRLGTLMTVLVLGLAVLLPLGLQTTLVNLESLDVAEEEWGSLTVFLTLGSDQDAAQSLADSLNAQSEVESALAVSPVEGLEELRESGGFGPSLELLEENPLPWVLTVTPAIDDTGEINESVSRLIETLTANPLVETVQYDRKWLERLGHLLELGRALVAVLTVMFALAVVVVVSNTIRLDVAARTEEIEIMALVGAPNSFIRQPFLYSGFWYGLLGGVVATVLLNGILIYLSGPMGRLLSSYGETHDILGPGLADTFALLLGSGALGFVGALMAVQRYLQRLKVGGSLGKR